MKNRFTKAFVAAMAIWGGTFTDAMADTFQAELLQTASSKAKSAADNTFDVAEEFFANPKRASNGGAAYAKFSLASLPKGEKITSAKLTCTVRSDDSKNRDITVYYVNKGNDLAQGTTSQNYLTDRTEIESYTVSANATLQSEIDVTAAVTTLASVQEYIIFEFGQTNGASMYLSGKASENAPVLEITTEASGSNVQTLTVGATGFATFCPSQNVDLSTATGIYAYKASVSGSEVNLTKVSQIAAGEGVLLHAVGGGEATEEVPVLATDIEKAADNAFVGTLEDLTVSETDGETVNYVLSVEDGVTGFFRAAAGGTKVAAGKAYLPVPAASAAKLHLVFAELPTAIQGVGAATSESAYYTLQGVRVGSPAKGLYIRDGKKVMVK